MSRTKFAAVILDDALDKPLDYAIPEELTEQVVPGMRVAVPVRGKERLGTIFSLNETSPYKASPISRLLAEEPHFTPDLFALALWISDYYACPLRKVLTLVLPSFVRKEAKPKEQLFIKSLLSQNKLSELLPSLRQKSPKQAAVLDILIKAPKGLFLTDLLEKAQVTRAPVDTLIKKNLLEARRLKASPAHDYFLTEPKTLSSEQQTALSALTFALDKGTFSPHLLFGVTGSGKTEVYLQAISHALSLGKAVLFLIPEIALTEQTIHRLRSRLPESIAILNHRLSPGERHDAWKKMRSGEIKIALGARSALFAPLPNLGLIIVDEEHDSSYKQNDLQPTYHARDVAVMRAKLNQATIVLGSATPSIESYHNAQSGKYHLLTLSKRPKTSTLPQVHIVDMRKEFEKHKGFTLFSDPLLSALKERLSRGEQTLLLLNRRGYHTAQTCLSCSHTLSCPHCDVTLTYHRKADTLTCHLCSYTLSPPPTTCPSCQSTQTLKFKGAGTEQVERALHAILPDVRTIRMDADTTRHVGSHDKLLKQFRSGKADVLIGTQMIAKGLDFPSVTLVGILNSDSGLHLPDFRAQENTFQLLTQVTGRSGRGELSGEVIIQTALPDHPTIQHAASQDYPAFFTEERAQRELFAYPPYARLIKLTFSARDEAKAKQAALNGRAHLLKHLPATFELYPVAPSGHAKVKDTYRFQLLIKGKKIGAVGQLLKEMQMNAPRDARLHIDVDPLSTYF